MTNTALLKCILGTQVPGDINIPRKRPGVVSGESVEGCISPDSLGNRAGGKIYMLVPFRKVQTQSLKNDAEGK